MSIIQPQPSIGVEREGEHRPSEVEKRKALNKIQQALQESPAGRRESSGKLENTSNRSRSKEELAVRSPAAERQYPAETETALVPVRAPA